MIFGCRRRTRGPGFRGRLSLTAYGSTTESRFRSVRSNCSWPTAGSRSPTRRSEPGSPGSDLNTPTGCSRGSPIWSGDQHPRPTALLLQNFPDEPGRDVTIPLTLDQNVERISVLIDGSPQVLPHPTDLDEHLVEALVTNSLRTWSRTAPPCRQQSTGKTST